MGKLDGKVAFITGAARGQGRSHAVRFAEDGADIVLANAGINTMSPTLEMEEDTWQTMIEINLTGAWKTVRAAVPHIVSGGRGGAVVLTSSLAALMTNENIAHYTAAKAGVVGLMEVLAKELAPQNIRVNSVHPTTIATDMVLNDATYRLFRPDLEDPTRQDFEDAAASMNPLPLPVPGSEEITNAIMYLVSDDARYVTGNTHVVDAGARL